ncbi:MAG: hypothetical protein H6740_11620 [Alphaproteobacteria bacterium]|nr:hypothetical protein [Alphaproteobacteria bacterium]
MKTKLLMFALIGAFSFAAGCGEKEADDTSASDDSSSADDSAASDDTSAE